MISYSAYKVLHLLGVFLILIAFGGQIVFSAVAAESGRQWRKLAGLTGGAGLFIALLAGFGLIARLGVPWPWPGWIFGKLFIWVILGMLTALVNRKPELGRLFWWLVVLLAFSAACLAVFKPF